MFPLNTETKTLIPFGEQKSNDEIDLDKHKMNFVDTLPLWMIYRVQLAKPFSVLFDFFLFFV